VQPTLDIPCSHLLKMTAGPAGSFQLVLKTFSEMSDVEQSGKRISHNLLSQCPYFIEQNAMRFTDRAVEFLNEHILWRHTGTTLPCG